MNSVADCVRQISMIQSQVSSVVDDKMHNKLFKKLEGVQKQLETLALGIFGKDLKDQVINLYGKIDNSLMQHKIEKIQKTAQNLEKSVGLKNQKKIEETQRLLESCISDLWNNYRPNLEERRLISQAERLLQKVDTFSNDVEKVEQSLLLINEALMSNDEKRAAFIFNNLSSSEQQLLCTYLPKKERSSFLHEIKGAAHNNKIFLRKR